MSRWIDNRLADRLFMVNRVSETKNIDPESVEKDWWVIMVLKAVFGMSMAKYAFFKGDTSLSKGWNLINRFSEDIDIALYRDFFLTERGLACAKCENNNQVKLLRKASRDFIHGEFKEELEHRLKEMGLDVRVEAVTTHMTAEGEKPIDHDADPTVVLVHYPSIFEGRHSYVKPVVKVEISCLSMREPFEMKRIASLISEGFASEDNEAVAEIATISPSRTFLEKAFLLCEEYQRRNPRTLRMSRHLYDLERLMDTEYGRAALRDSKLYYEIVQHRQKFYHVGGVDYALDLPERIAFCPTGEVRERLRADYENMRSSFIYGEALGFDDLMKRIEELEGRFRAVGKIQQ